MSLAATVLQDAIVRVGTKITSFENKLSEYGALRAINDDTSKLLAESVLENAKKSLVHVTKIPVLKKYTAANLDNDACTFTGDSATSAYINPTYSKFGFAINMIPEIHSHNYIDYSETMAHQLLMGWKQVFSRLDTAALAHLEASKDALTGKTSRYFTLASGAMNYTGNNLEIYAKMPGFLRTLDMNGGYIEVANTEALTSNLMMQTFGANNQQNLAGLINNNLPGSTAFKTYTTNRLAVGANKEVRYVFEEGSHALLNWIPVKARENYRITEANNWTRIQDPYFGFDWMVHYIKDCADVSALYPGLDAATVKEGWAIIGDFAFMDAYSSDTTAPTVKFTVNDPA